MSLPVFEWDGLGPGLVEEFCQGRDDPRHVSYLAPGGSWTQYDLTAVGKASPITSVGGIIVDQTGTVNVFSRDTNGHLQLDYLNPAVPGPSTT
jgi:hypothetical protein